MNDVISDVIETLNGMEPDDFNKLSLFQSLNIGTVNLHVALRVIARILQPRTYLEIGTRRGWSVVQVLSEAPLCDAYLVDSWIDGYAQCANPGELFVREEIKNVVPQYSGELTFWSGNSHDILPSKLRSRWFDLVCVDGDHTVDGAMQDLYDVMPHIRTGGVLIFDDVTDTADRPGDFQTLHEVWEWVQRQWPDWMYITHLPGKIGIAVNGARQ